MKLTIVNLSQKLSNLQNFNSSLTKLSKTPNLPSIFVFVYNCSNLPIVQVLAKADAVASYYCAILIQDSEYIDMRSGKKAQNLSLNLEKETCPNMSDHVQACQNICKHV